MAGYSEVAPKGFQILNLNGLSRVNVSRSYASALRQITYYAKTHFKIFLRSLNCGITVSLDIFVSVAISGCVFKLASDA